MAAAVLAAYLLERAVRVRSITDARTAAVTVFVALGLYLLLVLDPERMAASRSYAIGIVALVGALGAAYLGTLSAEPARDFFALAQPDLLDALIMIVATIAGIRLMAWAGLSPYPHPPQTRPARASKRRAAGLRLSRTRDARAEPVGAAAAIDQLDPVRARRDERAALGERLLEEGLVVLARSAAGVAAAPDRAHATGAPGRCARS